MVVIFSDGGLTTWPLPCNRAGGKSPARQPKHLALRVPQNPLFRGKLRLIVALGLGLLSFACHSTMAEESPFPGPRGAQLDLACRADIWTREPTNFLERFVRVPRDQVVAFALYTHDAGVLKMTAQLFPLQPGEPREVRLELKQGGQWREVAKAPVIYPGWSAHFRIAPWDSTRDVAYRVRHGESAVFTGLIRKDPREKDAIVVALFSCDSNADRGNRREFVDKLRKQNPDLLLFVGDQSYDHCEHTAAWLLGISSQGCASGSAGGHDPG